MAVEILERRPGMMDGTTEKRVRVLLEHVVGIPADAVVTSAPLDEIVPMDSLSLAELAAALDEEFQVEVPADELTTTLSVPALVALVDGLLRAAARRSDG
jgi:acyl carrier protein